MSAKLTFTPLTAWPGTVTILAKQRPHLGGAGTFESVRVRLQKELSALNGVNVRLCTFHREKDLRQDGLPKAGTRPTSSGVVLRFRSDLLGRYLSFATDIYREWTDNLRDIVMTLEGLRLLSTRGAVLNVRNSAAAYSSFTIPDPQDKAGSDSAGSGARSGASTASASPGQPDPKHLKAAAVLLKAGGFQDVIVNRLRVVCEAAYRGSVIKQALIKGHPDHGGNTDTYRAVLAARDLLRGAKA